LLERRERQKIAGIIVVSGRDTLRVKEEKGEGRKAKQSDVDIGFSNAAPNSMPKHENELEGRGRGSW